MHQFARYFRPSVVHNSEQIKDEYKMFVIGGKTKINRTRHDPMLVLNGRHDGKRLVLQSRPLKLRFRKTN